MTLIEAFNSFITYKKTYTREKTVLDYTQCIMPFINVLGQDIGLDCITQDQIYEYQNSLAKRGLRPATIASYMRQIKVFFDWCIEEYSSNVNIHVSAKKIKLPKLYQKNVPMYSIQQMQDIFNAVTIKIKWMNTRNKLIIALMYDSGLRQNEVANLKRKDIVLSDKYMTIIGKGGKERTVPIGNTSLALYKQYLQECPYQNDNVFVSKSNTTMTCDSIKHLIYKIHKKVDFEISSHMLRHNFATNYLLNQLESTGNADIYSLMTIMGHEEIETTMVYLHHAQSLYASKHHESQLDKLNLACI